MDTRDTRVERLLKRALDLPPAHRDSFVDEHAHHDPELRRRVMDRLHPDTDPTGALADGMTVSAEAGPTAVPDALGPYRVSREIGRGGMGIVYLATDPTLGRAVALKVLPPERSPDPAWKERFRSEARLIASINHPNIATIHSLEEWEDRTIITMEYVPGELLSERIGGRPLPVSEALPIGQQVAAALEAAHRSHVVHRDLKPSNVIVTPEGRVKVLDFGLAASLRHGRPGPSGAVAGTPGYMSPEQIRGEDTDERTDVWALGCLLYETLVGEPAFSGRTVRDRLEATLHADPALDRLPPSLPPTLSGLIRDSLCKTIEGRCSCITPLRQAIEEQLEQIAFARRLPASADPDRGPRSNLPRSLTSFVGRKTETKTLSERLAEHPVVTLVGAGGCGKSRLALETARANASAFPGGVWLVELAPLERGASIQTAVAAAIGLRDEPSMASLDAIARALRTDRTLLVLDNCEHLVDAAAAFVHDLSRRVEKAAILATSREPLGVEGESVFDVRPLGESAVRLFEQRARAVRPDFELTDEVRGSVETICRRLDGIPLAIELAAARVRHLSPAGIASRLDDRFRLLSAGHKGDLPHHRTLRGLIDWSAEQLDERERLFFTRLSVFSGGFALDAAEAVCTGDGIEPWDALELLSRLVDKSLVDLSEHAADHVRYRMLETVRAYAAECATDAERTREAFRGYFAKMATAAIGGLAGSEQKAWIRRIRGDYENLTSAYESGARKRPVAPETLPIVIALQSFLDMQGQFVESRRLGEEALALPGVADAESEDVGRVLQRLGNATSALADYDAALAYLARSKSLWQRFGVPENVAGVLNSEGLVALQMADLDTAETHFRSALAINRAIGDRDREASNLSNLGLVATQRDRTEEARDAYEAAMIIAKEVGNDFNAATFIDNLATAEDLLGRSERAEALHEEALAIHRELGNRRGEATTLLNLGSVYRQREEWDRARTYIRDSITLKMASADLRGTLIGIEALAEIAYARGESSTALRVFAAADAHRSRTANVAPHSQRKTIEKILAAIRSSLGPEAFDAEWAAGAALSVTDMIDTATR